VNFYNLLFQNAQQFRSACIAIIGGGGKSGLLWTLGHELKSHFNSVLLTTLTKARTNSPVNTFYYEKVIKNILDLSEKNNPLFIISEKISPEKYQGLSPAQIATLLPYFDVTVMESDGSRNQSIKAHNEIDPDVPGYVTHLIVVVGADVVNTRITDGNVHRSKLFQEIWGLGNDDRLSAKFIAEVITSKKGYLSKVKHQPVTVYYINKADKFEKNAYDLADCVAAQTASKVFIGSINSNWLKEYS
jgi:probable selenium-dependent hydroxylase accessory protein YqeC